MRHWRPLIILIASSLLLLIIFSLPQHRLKSYLQGYSEAKDAQIQAGRAPTGAAQREQPAGYAEDRRAILLQELSKTNDEIKMRLGRGRSLV